MGNDTVFICIHTSHTHMSHNAAHPITERTQYQLIFDEASSLPPSTHLAHCLCPHLLPVPPHVRVQPVHLADQLLSSPHSQPRHLITHLVLVATKGHDVVHSLHACTAQCMHDVVDSLGTRYCIPHSAIMHVHACGRGSRSVRMCNSRSLFS